VKVRTAVLLIAAVTAGLAAGFAASRLAPSAGRQHADYYCYELRRAWACADSKTECEARLNREAPSDVTKRCAAYWNDTLTP
jgi:hypothetical protein